MARGEKNKDAQLPPWWGGLAIVLGAICLFGALSLLLAEGDASWRDQRTISRGIVLGAALVALGLFSLVGRKPEKAPTTRGHAADGRPPAPTQASPIGAPERERLARANLEGMLLHSEDIVATLRDLVLHGQDQPGMADVRALLARSGLMEWSDAPNVRANRLRRNGRWWLSAPGTELDDSALERLIAVEAALNVGEDVSQGRGELDRRVRDALKIVDLRPKEAERSPLVGYLLEGAQPRGEWAYRMGLADATENLPAPLRVEFDFQANVRAGVACVDVCVPGPACFSFASDSAGARLALARDYALWLSLALANLALRPREGVTRVIVNGHARNWDDVLLSLDLTAETLRGLADAARSMDKSLPRDPALRMSLGDDGWLEAVEPFLRADDELVCPSSRFGEVELDATASPQPLVRACGARRICDLGIMEKAGRAGAWNAVVADLGETTQGAVAKFMELRSSSADLSVIEACDRVCRALVDGSADISNKRELAALFVDGGQLAAATRAAGATLNEEPAPERLEAMVTQLEGVLSPITETGLYLDDEDAVYRYFNSVAERVAYNLTVDDAGREVRLVPDEYYSAHSILARALTMLGRHGEALAHADELMRIAPVTPDAALCKVRCLEEQSRIFEAADLLKQAIGYSSTVRDMAICFYRLAYMEWKLGRNDLAVACYQRSIELHPEVAQNARSEMNDLIETNEGLRPFSADEVIPALEKGGLPSGRLDDMRARTRDAVVACADAEVFGIARQLASAMIELNRDDALIDVRRSLMRP
ncbi:MAG TPA: tetratricopeptide repeat protein [Candidatus Olsenella pullicola]|nr:tetratricopeptide repeat protein [Candidatus Olsenella pullicola]